MQKIINLSDLEFDEMVKSSLQLKEVYSFQTIQNNLQKLNKKL